ncbi:MAG: hypothetical protein D6B25_02200 [Desulfobulbaceae bacterium]|nr:MAG: hypothetical protein D6B25_02200 [Desulfobulbaceae bacterium]
MSVYTHCPLFLYLIPKSPWIRRKMERVKPTDQGEIPVPTRIGRDRRGRRLKSKKKLQPADGWDDRSFFARTNTRLVMIAVYF